MQSRANYTVSKDVIILKYRALKRVEKKNSKSKWNQKYYFKQNDRQSFHRECSRLRCCHASFIATKRKRKMKKWINVTSVFLCKSYRNIELHFQLCSYMTYSAGMPLMFALVRLCVRFNVQLQFSTFFSRFSFWLHSKHVPSDIALICKSYGCNKIVTHTYLFATLTCHNNNNPHFCICKIVETFQSDRNLFWKQHSFNSKTFFAVAHLLWAIAYMVSCEA